MTLFFYFTYSICIINIIYSYLNKSDRNVIKIREIAYLTKNNADKNITMIYLYQSL